MSEPAKQPQPNPTTKTDIAGGAGTVLSGSFSGPVTIMLQATPQLKEEAWQDVDWAGSLKKYHQELLRQYGKMQVLGMAHSVELDTIFTDAYLLDKPSAWRRYAIEELAEQGFLEKRRSQDQERYSGIELVQQQQRLFIFGKPGAGKTTFLKYLTMQAARDVIKQIPIFVALKAWADAGCELMTYIDRQFAICGFPRAHTFAEATLETGQALVLFDGLDEVNLEGQARERITSSIRDFAKQYGRCLIAITCRTAATDYMFEDFRYCEVADFSDEQVQIFASNWFEQQPDKLKAFRSQLAANEHSGLRDLARTPLLLTLLCLTFEETMQFPARRAELYEEALDALLKKWDSSRAIQRDTLYGQLSLGHKRQMLAEIAAWAFNEGKIFLRHNELSQRISNYLKRVPNMPVDADGNQVLRLIEAQHGILVERAQNIYSFSHLTFQEYFTAKYITANPKPQQFDTLIANAHDPSWREVLLLTASMLESEQSEILFKRWATQLKQLAAGDRLRPILGHAAWVQSANIASDYRNRVIVLNLDLDLARVLNRILDLARDLARDLDRAHDPAFAFASLLDVAPDFALDLARDLDFARDLVRDLNRHRDLDFARDLAHTLMRARARVGFPENELAFALQHELAHDLDLDLALARTTNSIEIQQYIAQLDRALAVANVALLRWRSAEYLDEQDSLVKQAFWWYAMLDVVAFAATSAMQAVQQNVAIVVQESLQQLIDAGIDRDLAQELFAAIPDESQPWQQFFEQTKQLLLEHKGIRYRWGLTEEQSKELEQYLTSTTRLVECLKLATIDNREAVLEELLLLPEEEG